MAIETCILPDGCRLAYRFDGHKDAPVLMLANSLGTCLEMWDPQINALKKHFRILRYDSRGHGRSDAPDGDYTMDRLGMDVVELLDGLGIDNVRFTGLSLGAMVGMWLGTHAVNRLNRLALCNSAAYMGPPDAWSARIEIVKSQGMAAIADMVIERWFTPGFRARYPEHVTLVRDMLLATPPQGYAGCSAAIRDMDQRVAITGITIPTLVIGGMADPATPPDIAREIAAAIQGSQLVMLEAAHLSNIEQPAAFTQALIHWMEQGNG